MYSVVGLISTNYATEGLGVLTNERTVASLPFGGRYRLIDFPLSNMVGAGIKTVGLITPYKYRSIIDHIGSGKPWALDRKSGGLYILPGSVFGISSAESRFILRDIERNKAFLERSAADYVVVTAANTVSRIDFADLVEKHSASGADMTLVCRRAAAAEPFMDALDIRDGRVAGVRKGAEKGDAMFLDCFVVNRELMEKILEWYKAINHLDLFEVLAADYDKMDVRPYEFDGYVGPIFTTDQYYDVSMELLKPTVREELFAADRPVLTKSHDRVPVKYVEGARVSNSLIQAGSRISGTVENSIVSSEVVIEAGARVKNCIILQDCHICAGAAVENAIIDRANVIAAGAVIRGAKGDPFIFSKSSGK